jgi:hypothetical protein
VLKKKPNSKIVVPVVIAVFLVLASFVAVQTYIAQQASEVAQPHFNLVLAFLFSVFATAATIIAVYESRLRFNVRPDTV